MHTVSTSRSAYVSLQARPWVSRLAKAMAVWLLAQNLFVAMPASAQNVLPTTPDKNAPSGQRPIMDAAQNGVPIVHIAPPSAAGVSRNQYNQFNVNSNGLILNNSTGNVQTQLGGWITGNMQLGPTPARIILNEVIGNNNSQLRGTIEVAGQRADIVIANPNGITCDGCGFLNTTRTTLTTGQPQFGAGGSLDALDVRQGQITIGGNGLNATNLEQLDLIARGMVIEGEVWAKNLNAIAGVNKVLYGTLQQTAQNGSGPAPQFAIDIKDLGGMYANQVYMIATEKGLGVNSTGRIAALQGNLILSANGDLTLKDTYAKQNIQLASTGKATLQGNTLSEGGTTITAGGRLTQQGVLDVQDQLKVAGGSIVNSGTIVQRGTQGAQLASGDDIDNTGTLYSASKIEATGAVIRNQGGEIGAATVSLSGTALDNAHGSITGNDVAIHVTSGTLDNTQGQLSASRALTIESGNIKNDAGVIAGNASISLDLQGGVLSNTNGGQLISNADLKIANASVDNTKGAIASVTGKLQIDAAGKQLLNDNGTLMANGNVDLTVGAVSNQNGLIYGQDLTLQTAGFDNNKGAIVANGKATLKAGALSNAGGLLQSSGDMLVDTHGAALTNIGSGTSGGIIAGGTLTLNAGSVNNQAGFIASTGNQSIAAAGDIDNTAIGQIVTDGDTTLVAARVLNQNGSIQALGNVEVTANAVSNNGGTLAANKNVTLNVASFDNRALGNTVIGLNAVANINATNTANNSVLSAGQALTVNAGNLANAGEISGQNVALNVTGTLDNGTTGLIDAQDTRISAGMLNNTGRIYGDILRINAGTVNNDSTGVIAARNTLLLGAQNLNNTNGALIYSLGDIFMAGMLDASGNLQGQMQRLVNGSSRIEAVGNLTINSASIENRNDRLQTTMVSDAPVYQEYVQRSGGVTYPVSLCMNVGSGGDTVGCIVHPDKYGQRQTIPTVYHEECGQPAGWGESAPCWYTPNYSINSPVFDQFGVTRITSPAPVEPWSGCSYASGDTTYDVNTPECNQWRDATSAYNASVKAMWAELDSKINAYNASVNEDNRLDVFEDYTWFKINSTTSRPVVTDSAPGQIIAGGNMTLIGATVNRDSEIVAGGALDISGPSVQNLATQGTVQTVYNGTAEFTHVETCGSWPSEHHCRKWDAVNPYSPAPTIQYTNLNVLRYQAYAGNQTATRTLVSATGAIDPATSSIIMAAGANNHNATQSAQTAATGAQHAVVTETGKMLTTPSGRLFIVHAEPGARYLVETDPHFTNYKTFISSDYFLQAFNQNPVSQQKRYGDGFAEQQRVNDQILALTGRRYLDGYTNTETEYTALMNAGVAFAQQYQLTPGVALTAAQMALLTTDIVWLETQTVQLADGSTQQVLVPQVYLRRVQDGDLQATGALIAGSSVTIQSQGNLVNSGTIAGNTIAANAGNDLVNQSGRISGQNIALTASNDLKSLSGVITGTGANSTVNLLAGRDIVLQTQTIGTVSADGNSIRTNVQRVATVQGGTVQLGAGRDMTVAGANVSADTQLTAIANGNLNISAVAGQYQLNVKDVSGTSMADGIDAGVTRTGYIKENATTNQLASLHSGGNLTLAAGKDLAIQGADIKAGTSGTGDALLQAQNISIEGVKDRVGSDNQIVYDRGYTRTARDNETYISGQVAAAGNLSVIATGKDTNGNNIAGQGNIAITGGYLKTDQGQLTVAAANDITVTNGSTNHLTVDDSYYISHGFLSTTKDAKASTIESTQVEGSVLSGNSIVIAAGDPAKAVGNITVTGSTVVADNDVTMSAGRNVTIDAGQQTSDVYQASRKETSGLFSSGAGITIGSKELTQKQTERTLTNVGSSVGSLNGNVSIAAGNDYVQNGSQLVAAGDIDIAAKRIDIGTVTDTGQSQSETTFKQSGLSISVSSPLISALQNVGQQAEATTKVKDARMKALGAMNMAVAGYQTAQAAQQTASNPNVSISITVGTSKSESKQTQSSTTAVGSVVQAGGDIRLAATGDGNNSTLTVTGSDIAAGKNATLVSDGTITLQAAQDTAEQHSTNSSSSAAVGVAISVGSNGASFGFTASASAARGHADGNDVININSHVTAGDTLILQSGTDTNLRGAVASGKQVIADVGGNLNVESLQDTSVYNSKQQSIGGSMTIGMGVSGSVNYSNTNANSNYASVTEQSGIRAGDQGFQIKVNGNTDLKGGAIASTQAAIEDNKNSLITGTLTTSDIQNHATANASTSGIGLSSDMLGQGAYGAAKALGSGLINNGSESGSSSGVTRSAISMGEVKITDEAGQQALTGKTVEQAVARLNRDTDNAQTAAQKQDVQAMKETVEAEQKIKQAAYGNLIAVTDAVYFADNGAKKILLLKKCDPSESGCGANGTKTAEIDVSKTPLVTGPDGKIYVFNNGINNTEQESLSNAAKQLGDKALEQGIYVVVNPYTGNIVSEVVYAGVDKLREITGSFGMSNSAEANIDLRNAVQQYNQTVSPDKQLQIVEVDHSRGSMTGSIATQNQVQNGNTQLPLSTVTFNGGAANAERMADAVQQATSRNATQGQVWESTHKDDFVGTFFGGNVVTGGNTVDFLKAHSSYTTDLPPERLNSADKNPLRALTDATWGDGQISSPILVSPTNRK